ncbi:M56 family metallopeptidase [Ideonella sp. YS5]|uniref:M56 family metallopeptidase n=1 Tax=Ideonella sp. YS5 TaxID=3453714 RepID=UPI003EE9D4CA
MNAALEEVVVRLGMALLHFVWQGALVGCLAAIGLALLRNARPQARYALCGTALVLCMCLPAWHVLAPAPAPAEAWMSEAPIHVAGVTATMPHRVQALSVAALAPGLPAVVLIWSIGAALMSLRLALGVGWVRRLHVAARASNHRIDPVWTARLAELAQRMGLRRLPRLHVLEGVEGPVTVGRWRPIILLPAALLARMPAELLEALLAHELAHIRRLDYLANLVQSIVEVLLFYHPVVWWLSHRIRIEREQIADDLAAEALGNRRQLALALSELARWQSPQPLLALAAKGGSLMTRIRRLVRPIHQPLGGKLLLPFAGLAALAIAAHASGLAAAAAPVARTPAASTVPATQAVQRPSETRDDRQPFAFAFISEDGSSTMSADDQDMRELQARRKGIHGDFLWVRQGTQRYVVTDPAALAEVRALWAPVQAFDAKMDELGQQMDAQSEALERVARETEAVHEAPAAELQALGKEMALLQKQRDKAQAEVDKLTRRMNTTRDEKQLARLEQQQEQLERSLEPLDESIEALSDQMDRVSESLEQALHQRSAQHEQQADQAMEELGRQMEALSRQQEAAEKAAEEQLRALLQDLVRRGLVRQG